MKELIAYLLLILNLLLIQNANAALVVGFDYNGKYYEIYNDSLSWNDARATAQTYTYNGMVGSLADVDSAGLNTEIHNKLQANIASFGAAAPDGGNARYAWIGANDLTTEGTWVWDQSGTNFWTGTTGTGSAQGGAYENWGSSNAGEPDDFNNQDAAAIAIDNWTNGVSGEWNDISVTNALAYVVQYNVVPEPSQAALLLGFAILAVTFMNRRLHKK